MTFYVGQKVVCVDADSPPLRAIFNSANPLAHGEIYTITAIDFRPFVPGILLIQCAELPSINEMGGEDWYQARRFRPVVSQGMEILKRIAANPPKELIGEDA